MSLKTDLNKQTEQTDCSSALKHGTINTFAKGTIGVAA